MAGTTIATIGEEWLLLTFQLILVPLHSGLQKTFACHLEVRKSYFFVVEVPLLQLNGLNPKDHFPRIIHEFKPPPGFFSGEQSSSAVFFIIFCQEPSID
jgi:hypothetical protein